MTRMLIIGPPGSGKGTQAERISERLGVVAISTGDIFRDNVKRETPLGVEAKAYMDAGDFVPDSVTNSMVRDRLAAYKAPRRVITVDTIGRAPNGKVDYKRLREHATATV